MSHFLFYFNFYIEIFQESSLVPKTTKSKYNTLVITVFTVILKAIIQLF